MTLDRRTFMQRTLAVFVSLLPGARLRALVGASASQDAAIDLKGTWQLVTYTYTSNGNLYRAPENMEAVAHFTADRYDVEFSTYTGTDATPRTRKASESGSYSVSGSRVRLWAEEASQDNEKGEEFLTEVAIDGDDLRLSSNNGANTEVWKRVA